MGETAELLAREFAITREEQDAFAVLSHERARAAQGVGASGRGDRAGVAPPKYKAQQGDDGPREGQSVEGLARLKPFFDRAAGTVTVGNACPVTDGAVGAAAVRRGDGGGARARAAGLHRRAGRTRALDGERMGLGPAYATAKLLDGPGWDLDTST